VIATITDPAYSAQPATGELTISKGQSKLTWTPYTTVSSPDVAIGANVLNAQCSEPGEVAYTAVSQDAASLAVTPASFLTVGQYTLTGVCTPLDSKDYASSSGSVSLSVINDTVFVSNLVGDVSMFFNNGVSQGPDTTSGGVGVAVDRSGNVWSIDSSGNSVTKFDKTGAMLSVSTGGGLSSPKALAVDDSGRVWIANGGGTLSALQTDGTPASTAAYANPALSGPTSVAIDFKGSVWVANESSNTITEVSGVAAPTVTPMIAEVTQPQ
jgi:streptogramin lyase